MKLLKSLVQSALALTIIILLLVALPVPTALADSSGPSDAGVGTNVSSVGSASWSDPNNITFPVGEPYATVVLNKANLISNYLQGTQYGFAIPSNATIFGISVVINRQSSFHNPSIVDNFIRLVKGGTIVGDNNAIATPWPLTLGTATYGGPTDLWGTTWTPADINSSDFGVVLSARRQNNGNNDRTATVDYMQITVYYSYETSMTVQCGSGLPEVAYGDSLTCMATVTQVTGTNTPSGTVSWATDSSGTFDLNPCVLTELTVGTSTCSVNYTPNAVESGFHLITATYSGDAYFSPTTSSKYISVIQRPVTVTTDPETKVYGDPDPELTYQITEGSLVFSDTFTGTLTRDPVEDVGTYPILQGTLALSDNYTMTYVGANLTITARPITVTADAKSKVFGQPDPVLTYTITSGSLAFSDAFTGSLTRVAGESVGTYAIQKGSLALTTNYALSYIGANLTITNQRYYLPVIIK